MSPDDTRGAAVAEVRTLTGLRALAALMVLAYHYDRAFPELDVASVFQFIHYGHLGVDVFFALSGYILCHAYDGRLARFEPGNAKAFWLLRLARVYPAHVVALAMTVAIWAVARFVLDYRFTDPGQWRLAHLGYHLTLTHAWGLRDLALWNAPSWSISSEWLAYLTLPFGLPLLRRARRAVQGVVLVACASVLVAVFGFAGVEVAAAYQGPSVVVRILAEFWLGASIYLLAREIPPGRRADAVAGAIVVAMVVAPHLRVPEIVIAVMAPVLVAALHRTQGAVRRLFASPWAVYTGRISYSIYIIHFPVQLLLMKAYALLEIPGTAPALQLGWYLGTMVCAVVAGSVLFHAIEEPFRRAARRRIHFRPTAPDTPRPV